LDHEEIAKRHHTDIKEETSKLGVRALKIYHALFQHEVLPGDEVRIMAKLIEDEQDPEVDLDVCSNGTQVWEINYVMKNSFGFGGLNACAIFKKFSE
jgi:hypothetical protein